MNDDVDGTGPAEAIVRPGRWIRNYRDDQQAFIHIGPDGNATISGGMVFCRGPAVYVESATTDTPANLFEHITFYTRLPRWWQLRRWARLLRDLRAHTGDAQRTANPPCAGTK